VRQADAAALPVEDGASDLVVSFMVLMNVDDMEGVVREAARVLEPGGRFCCIARRRLPFFLHLRAVRS